MNERERWEGLVDALAADEPLADAERQRVAQLDGLDDPWIQQERDVYRALAAAGEPEPLHDVDRQRAEQTLAAFRRDAGRGRRSGWTMGLGAAVLAVAAAAVLWWWSPTPDAVLAPERAVVASGVMMLDGAELRAGDAVPVDRWVVARDRACVRAGSATGCAAASSRLRVDDARIELSEGRVELSGSGRVVTDLGTVVVADGHSTVELSRSTLRATAGQGTVILESDGTTQTLAAGQSTTRARQVAAAEAAEVPPAEPSAAESPVEESTTPPPRRAPRARSSSSASASASAASASELLSAARGHVAAGEVGRAVAAYGTLRRQHPGTPEAHAADVSIGELELRRGRAKPALRAFARYLSDGGGALSEEAHWGKIRALHRLDRRADRDAAVAALRRAHPGSVYISRASAL